MAKYEKVLNQTIDITSEFNKEMFIEAIRAQLGSKIFTELVQNENDGLRITVSLEVLKEEREKEVAKIKEINKDFDDLFLDLSETNPLTAMSVLSLQRKVHELI